MFPYANHPLMIERMQLVRDTVREQAELIELYQPEARGLAAIWEEFVPDWLEQVENFAQGFVADQLHRMEQWWTRNGRNNPRYNDVMATISNLRNQIPNMRFPNLN